MKVLMLNGSPRRQGNCFAALSEAGRTLAGLGIESEIFWLGSDPVRDCVACGGCRGTGDPGKCVFDGDPVNEVIEKAQASDGFIFATPVYYAHPSGLILSTLDRCFFAGSGAFANKPGAAIAVARRAGAVSALDVLNKYFTINGMPVASSTYWNVVFGAKPAEAAKDAEGMQTVRNLARSMARLLGALEDAEEPLAERGSRTNFIR
ncbi:MAG: flavodoxin family protein [Clostridia bacterium]|nr:flavodoxin family protein [Clostridia bacterium]